MLKNTAKVDFSIEIIHSFVRREFSLVDTFQSANGRFDRGHWFPLGIYQMTIGFGKTLVSPELQRHDSFGRGRKYPFRGGIPG